MTSYMSLHVAVCAGICMSTFTLIHLYIHVSTSCLCLYISVFHMMFVIHVFYVHAYSTCGCISLAFAYSYSPVLFLIFLSTYVYLSISTYLCMYQQTEIYTSKHICKPFLKGSRLLQPGYAGTRRKLHIYPATYKNMADHYTKDLRPVIYMPVTRML